MLHICIFLLYHKPKKSKIDNSQLRWLKQNEKLKMNLTYIYANTFLFHYTMRNSIHFYWLGIVNKWFDHINKNLLLIRFVRRIEIYKPLHNIEKVKLKGEQCCRTFVDNFNKPRRISIPYAENS